MSERVRAREKMNQKFCALENMIKNFPYRGTDARSKPATMREAKMKQKASRKIVGTFSEVSTLIRSLPQVLFNHIKVTRNNVSYK